MAATWALRTRRMPARPFMVLNERIASDAAETAMDAILQGQEFCARQ